MTSTSKSEWPRRIICLTAETTELVFALGVGEQVVGISGYSVRPPEARLKEKVAAFTSLRMDKIRQLQPDLILGFSDLQKDMARDLIAAGYNVFVTNQRSIQEILDTILAVGRLVGKEARARELQEKFQEELARLEAASRGGAPVRVYFEEWDDPMITGIGWVSELIARLGGEDVFAHKSQEKIAAHRVVRPEEVIEADPQVIVASWCGKKVNFEKIRSRPGWDKIRAVRENRLYEIKSSDILQPGLSLLRGASQLAKIFSQYSVDGIR